MDFLKQYSQRRRAVNFNDEERNTLVVCAQREVNIINSRVTNGFSNSSKRAAWLRIAADFNSRGHETKRTAQMLKSCWSGMRSNARKLARANLAETGDEPSATSIPDSEPLLSPIPLIAPPSPPVCQLPSPPPPPVRKPPIRPAHHILPPQRIILLKHESDMRLNNNQDTHNSTVDTQTLTQECTKEQHELEMNTMRLQEDFLREQIYMKREEHEVTMAIRRQELEIKNVELQCRLAELEAIKLRYGFETASTGSETGALPTSLSDTIFDSEHDVVYR